MKKPNILKVYDEERKVWILEVICRCDREVKNGKITSLSIVLDEKILKEEEIRKRLTRSWEEHRKEVHGE